jgi:putative two-component system response regulator
MERFHEDAAVARLSERLALECGYSPGEARQIRTAARLHDIGKIAVPRNILDKPGPLTPEEMEAMKSHTILGAEMLAGLGGKIGKMVRNVCRFHHEWYNKAGYWGKAAGELPVYVPIVSICDVYMGLTSARPYKVAWPADTALEYMQNKAGTQFCPALTDAFCSMMRRGGVSAILSGKDSEGWTERS